MPGMYQYLLKSGQIKSYSNHVPIDAFGESGHLQSNLKMEMRLKMAVKKRQLEEAFYYLSYYE